MFTCVDQNAGRNYNIKRRNESFDMVRHLKYLGTTLMNENSIQGDIKSRLKSRSACYHSVQMAFQDRVLRRIFGPRGTW